MRRWILGAPVSLVPAARRGGRLARARRGGAEPGGDRRARGPCPGLVAGRERLRDGGSRAVRTVVLGLVAMALVLAGCGAFFRPRPTGVEAMRSPAEEAPRPPAPEPLKLVEQLTRVASELSELQNVVAKLMASSRQLEDQLGYLHRPVGEPESQSRSRAAARCPTRS